MSTQQYVEPTEFTRAEAMEAIRQIYQEWCAHESRREGLASTRLPDYERLLDAIETVLPEQIHLKPSVEAQKT